MNKHDKKGFTLAELLIVVAIIAVLVAISIPILSQYVDKARNSKNLANANNIKRVSQVLADDFYNENGGSWDTWSSTQTVYKGDSSSKGTGKLNNFITDVRNISGIPDLAYFNGAAGDRFFIACMNKQGQILHVIYFDEEYYAYIGTEGEKYGKMKDQSDGYIIWLSITKYELKNNYGRNALETRHSYVVI